MGCLPHPQVPAPWLLQRRLTPPVRALLRHALAAQVSDDPGRGLDLLRVIPLLGHLGAEVIEHPPTERSRGPPHRLQGQSRGVYVVKIGPQPFIK